MSLISDLVSGISYYLPSILKTHAPDVTNLDEFENTPLHIACRYGDLARVHVLLEHDAEVNILNRYGKTPFHYAMKAKSDNSAIIELLIQHGLDLKRTNPEGDTILHLACYEGGNIANFKPVINAISDLNVRGKDRRTILHCAANSKQDNTDLIHLLIKQGVNTQFKDHFEDTPLHIALLSEHIINAKTLIDLGADPDATNMVKRTPLHYAAEIRNQHEITKKLLEKGADPTKKDRSGYTALHLAFRKGYPFQFQTLIENKAGLDVQDDSGKTVLHYLAESKEDNSEWIILLRENGADTLIQDKQGRTIFDLAKDKGNINNAWALKKPITGSTEIASAKPIAPDLGGKEEETPIGPEGIDEHLLPIKEPKQAELMHEESMIRLRARSLVVILASPIVGAVGVIAHLVLIVRDTLQITWLALSHLRKLEVKKALKASLIEAPKAVFIRIARAVAAPFYAIGLFFAGFYGALSPESGRDAMNCLTEKWNDGVFDPIFDRSGMRTPVLERTKVSYGLDGVNK